MQKIYYLSTCNTCKRVMDEIKLPASFTTQDIKKEGITEEQLQELYELTKSYEALFSRRARLYQERDLKNKDLQEEDFKKLILEHYTFLKRPVIINNNEIFIGSSSKTVAAAKTSIHKK
ncbi:MAG TPA: ArsC/Spx/MgsR family protein [Aequorivita sp.]|nr:ArsC/Spx/MgsR family protein [Aequorivita sp.]